jgi:hypothetical protein
MKFYSVYGNCQGMILAEFLNNNPVFKNLFHYIPLTPCNLINDAEIEDFIKNAVKKLDLFIYIPISDDYRNDFKFSSNYFLSQLSPECIKISFPSLYYNVYDRQMTYLTDEKGNRVRIPSEYHDKILIKMYMTYNHLKNEEIFQKYIENINNYENFSKPELEEAATSNYRELKRRENLLIEDKRNNYVLRIADFIFENYQNQRLFYTLNHPSKFVYLHLREQLFRHLRIENVKADFNPLLDPHTDFMFGIFPPVRKYLELSFEDNTPFPSNSISYNKYLDFYRSFSKESLAKIGVYPLCGRFTFSQHWSADEKTHRWAEASDADIVVYNDQARSEKYYLFFTLFVIRSQTIRIFMNGSHYNTVDFSKGERSSFIHLKVHLNAGENRLKFLSDTPPFSPGGHDPRSLSFAVAQFSVIKENDL